LGFKGLIYLLTRNLFGVSEELTKIPVIIIPVIIIPVIIIPVIITSVPIKFESAHFPEHSLLLYNYTNLCQVRYRMT